MNHESSQFVVSPEIYSPNNHFYSDYSMEMQWKCNLQYIKGHVGLIWRHNIVVSNIV